MAMARNDRLAEEAVQAADSDVAYFPASRPWSEEGGAVRLHGSRCGRCGGVAFPAHKACPSCGAESGQDEVLLSPTGTLYSFSEIHVAPKGFATPYAVSYVDLPEGVRLFGQIEGRATELRIGQTVAVALGPVRADTSAGTAGGAGGGRTVISYRFKGLP
jgi:uncharacterized OB-fold protein